MASILTLTGSGNGLASEGKPKKPKKPRSTNRPTKDLKVGQCMCILNTRTKKGVTVCRVPPGETRSGIKFKGSCPNPINTKK
jgi:hypothetical protein